MKSLAREFCRWTDTLGAGEPSIDQETIETLFAPSKADFHLIDHNLQSINYGLKTMYNNMRGKYWYLDISLKIWKSINQQGQSKWSS